MSAATQSFVPIKDILNDVVVLKDGGMVLILKTSAVNFDLLSENEQLAIISSFAGLLNSLSFYIQIVIRSKRLDISSYLGILDKAIVKQENPLLKEMMQRYKVFVETTISENDVLDKQFYIAVQVSRLEAGFMGDGEKNIQKALTILIPRREHLIRQLARIGLKASQLTTTELVRLFFDYYNQTDTVAKKESEEVVQAETKPVLAQKTAEPETIEPIKQMLPPLEVPEQEPQAVKQPLSARSMPFVVEELPDEYGVI